MTLPEILPYLFAGGLQPAWTYAAMMFLEGRTARMLAIVLVLHLLHLLAAVAVGPVALYLLLLIIAGGPWWLTALVLHYLRSRFPHVWTQ